LLFASDLTTTDFGFLRRESVASGPGKYIAVVAYQNAAGFGCVTSWEFEARIETWERKYTPLGLSANEVQRSDMPVFAPLVQVSRLEAGPKALVFLNVDTVRRGRSTPEVPILADVVAIARGILQHPGLSQVALVAFSLEDGKVIFSEHFGSTVRIQAIQSALDKLDPSVISLGELDGESPTAFLNQLLERHTDLIDLADMIAFVGATSPIQSSPDEFSSEKLLRNDHISLAYFVNVRHEKARRSFRRPKDMLDRVVADAGGKTFPIETPLDLGRAVSIFVSAASR